MKTQGVSRVDGDVADKMARDVTSSDLHVFVLPKGIHDKTSLFDAIRETIPLDPPIGGGRHNWDALADSLFSGLQSASESEVLVVWPDASGMLRASAKDFETFVAILGDLVQTLADPKVTNGPVKEVAVILGGTWA